MKNILPTLFLTGAALLSASGAAAQTPAAGQSGAAGQGAATPSQYPSAQSSGAGSSAQTSAGSAQGNSRNSSAATTAGAVTVTGCLAKGDSSDEFTITDSSGKTYELMAGGSVNLKPHVGHQVAVTGSPMASSSTSSQKTESSQSSTAAGSAPTQSNSASSKTTAHSEGGNHLHVSDLKMISTSCSK